MDDLSIYKIFTIHFPGKKVYIENTCESLYDKMEEIKSNKDHTLFTMLQEYPNPEIRVEYYKGKITDKKLVAKEYSKDNYEILNFNLLPPPKFNLFQSIYKWMAY